MKRSLPLIPLAAGLVLTLVFKFLILDLAVVEGPSMLPTLRQGEVVLVFRAAYGLRLPPGLGSYLLRWANPRPGELVAAENPDSGEEVVKRVRALRAVAADSGDWEQRVFIVGDNPAESLDSREYGEVAVEKIAGRVLIFGKHP